MNAGTVSRPRTAAEDFAEFVDLHARALGRLAHLLVNDEQVAEDLVAEVLLGAWRTWPAPSRSSRPETALRRTLVERALGRDPVARRECVALQRLPDSGPTTGDIVARSALLRIPPGQRACLVLRYAAGFTEHEVAQTLGIDLHTMRSQLAGAVALLRAEIPRGRPAPRRPGGTIVPTAADPEWGRHVR